MFRSFSERPLRIPYLKPYVPNPNDPSIFWFNSERRDIVHTVVERVVQEHSADPRTLELTLNEVALQETRRLSQQRDAEADAHLGEWRGLMRRIARMGENDKRQVLTTAVERFALDVAGNFDPRVYQFARRVVPKLLTGVMRPSRLVPDLLSSASYAHRLLSVEGEVDILRKLQSQGTLIYVPTHSSNLDSLALAQSLEMCGLPPVIYGAGKNLFTNPIISFFMHNLGAYRVDRRIKSDLYKEVLKAYSCVMIERGYHSLFFPGGTRSRSGMVERRLKLGLAGTALEAFARNQAKGIRRPIWFVPTTINYALVLEAETLVEDWLTEEGRGRYIIEDDEFSRIDRWVAFFRRMVGLSAACVIRFGRPVDPYGNEVDDDGRSLAPRGRVIDPGSYVLKGGRHVVDKARDAAYTRELGEMLVDKYQQETVMMSSNVVAHVLFRRLVRTTPGIDLFARLRMRGEVAMEREELLRDIGATRDRLLDLEARGRVRVSPFLRDARPEQMLELGMDAWNGYHSRVAARDAGTSIVAEDPTLLLYYQNRLVTFAVELAGEEDAQAAREIHALGVWR
jgi:glycerol-3-phosphate O-acyltransferase